MKKHFEEPEIEMVVSATDMIMNDDGEADWGEAVS